MKDRSRPKEEEKLIEFWDQAFTLTEEKRVKEDTADPESWKALAPSEKLFRAAAHLGRRNRVLDYGCGTGWAGIIAAKSGCPDVTAADPAPGAVRAAGSRIARYGLQEQIRTVCIGKNWLEAVPSETYDGLFCSNVLDVIPPETAEEVIRESARIVTPDASVIVGLNYYMSPEKAAGKGLELTAGNRLYLDGVLRLVSRPDEEWADLFSTWYIIEKLEHFAWPNETANTRRLFYLRKSSTGKKDFV